MTPNFDRIEQFNAILWCVCFKIIFRQEWKLISCLSDVCCWSCFLLLLFSFLFLVELYSVCSVCILSWRAQRVALMSMSMYRMYVYAFNVGSLCECICVSVWISVTPYPYEEHNLRWTYSNSFVSVLSSYHAFDKGKTFTRWYVCLLYIAIAQHTFLIDSDITFSSYLRLDILYFVLFFDFLAQYISHFWRLYLCVPRCVCVYIYVCAVGYAFVFIHSITEKKT